MAFGNQLFQLAQGIIANEQQRKRLELQEKQQQVQLAQAERSFKLRAQEVEARQGFLDIQKKQLEFKAEQEQSPKAARKRALELDFLEARINSMRADAQAKGQGKVPSVSDTLRLGDEHRRIARDAKIARTDLAIRNIVDGQGAPSGINGAVVAEALSATGVRSWEGLQAAIEAVQKDVRSVENATNIPTRIKTQRLDIATRKREALIAAQAQLRKVFDQEVSPGEFRKAAPDSFPNSFVDELFNSGGTAEVQKLDIWGDSIFAGGRNKMLDTAITQLRNGNQSPIQQFIQMFPGKLLDGDGRITVEGQKKLAPYFAAEGVPLDTAIELIRTFNQR